MRGLNRHDAYALVRAHSKHAAEAAQKAWRNSGSSESGIRSVDDVLPACPGCSHCKEGQGPRGGRSRFSRGSVSAGTMRACVRACTVHTTVVVGLRGHTMALPLTSMRWAWRRVGLRVRVRGRARTSRCSACIEAPPSRTALAPSVAWYGNSAASHSLIASSAPCMGCG
jgi:hypothetical protein